MKNDTVLIAFFVGIGATALNILISIIFQLIGLINTPLHIFVGKLAIGELSSPQWIIVTVGIIGHLMIGSIFALVFVLTIQRWGDDYIYLKGLALGSFLWVLHQIVIPNIITSDITLKISASSQIFHIIIKLIWGLTASFIYVQVYNKRIIHK